MDNGGNYPFFFQHAGKRVLIYRFSKDSLVALTDEPHRRKVRTLIEQAVSIYLTH